MITNKEIITVSKFLSWALRHHPTKAGITLDANGYTNVDTLLDVLQTRFHTDFNITDLIQIVDEDDKQRYTFNAAGTKLRANQGHSIDVNLDLLVTIPPVTLYHGTAAKYLPQILNDGLLPRGRQYVHLSADISTAVDVGTRHGSPVVLEVAAYQMFESNYEFYLSKNNVWLTKTVPPKYLTKLD